MADSSNKSPIKDSRVLGTISLALAVVLFLAINVFTETTIKGVQFDLTEKSLYTLSDGTKETLAAVKEPITLRFFSHTAAHGIDAGSDSLWRARAGTPRTLCRSVEQLGEAGTG